jgi:hypothetical protein
VKLFVVVELSLMVVMVIVMVMGMVVMGMGGVVVVMGMVMGREAVMGDGPLAVCAGSAGNGERALSVSE